MGTKGFNCMCLSFSMVFMVVSKINYLIKLHLVIVLTLNNQVRKKFLINYPLKMCIYEALSERCDIL